MTSRAVAVVLGEPHHELKQWAALVEYCAEHRYELTAVVRRDPDAAVALADAGHVDVVVAVYPDRRHVLDRAAARGVRVEFLRRTGVVRPTSGLPLIAAMLARGGTPKLVAQLLDVPLAEVEAVARPRSTRQPPADHPWRADWPETVERRTRVQHN